MYNIINFLLIYTLTLLLLLSFSADHAPAPNNYTYITINIIATKNIINQKKKHHKNHIDRHGSSLYTTTGRGDRHVP